MVTPSRTEVGDSGLIFEKCSVNEPDIFVLPLVIRRLCLGYKL